MVGRRSAGRKTADSFVDLRPHQPTRTEKLAREFKMRPEIVAPVEARSRNGRIHYTEANHGSRISLPPRNQAAALGFRAHSGWAVGVVVTGSRSNLEVLERRRIEIADAAIPGSKQPYHAA